ncbi:pyridoxal phosphate-dependent aminotransferase [Virgibacillus sp. W0181]|uniref:pyridoxal phosphate-dependent aminotransferase n=1 Tax=Virgibacillus sp. W0181 TaxID=3391581 RepID=UPI003F475C91
MRIFQRSETLDRLPEQFFVNLTNKVQELEDQGHDVINLGRGNPDTPTPDHIIKALEEAAQDPTNHKYAPFRGFPYLKEAVAKFYKSEYDVEIDPEKEVAVLFGSRAGLIELSQCLLNPGDTALLPNPGYPDYETGIALANAQMERFPLLKEHNFLPDYDSMSKEMLDRAKLMFLNYPNNPTAAMATKEFFDETIEVAKKHQVCVVHDFAYGAFGFDGEKPISFLQSEGAKEVGIETYTLSKTYNMAGWRVAFAVGNPSVIEHINKLQDHLYASIFGAVQYAAAEALTGDQSVVKQLNDMYESRRNIFIKKLNEIGWNVEGPKGTFFAWLPVPKGYTSEEFSDLLLKEAYVVTAPGNGFGKSGEGYVRIGLLDSEERLVEAAERIGKLNIFKG